MNKTLESVLSIIDNYLADRRGISVGQHYTLEELRKLPSFAIERPPRGVKLATDNFRFMEFIENERTYKVHLRREDGNFYGVFGVYEVKQIDNVELRI